MIEQSASSNAYRKRNKSSRNLVRLNFAISSISFFNMLIKLMCEPSWVLSVFGFWKENLQRSVLRYHLFQERRKNGSHANLIGIKNPHPQGFFLNYKSEHPFEHMKGVMFNLVDRALLLYHPQFHKENIRKVKYHLFNNPILKEYYK